MTDQLVRLPELDPMEADVLYRVLDAWCRGHDTVQPEWPIVNSLRTAVGEARRR